MHSFLRSSFVVITIIGVSALLFCGCASKPKSLHTFKGPEAREWLIGRPWVDHLPKDPRSKFLSYIFTKQGLGFHDEAQSHYKHLIELFDFRATENAINFYFPHDNRQAATDYKVERIRGEDPLDLRLTLNKDPQKKGQQSVFYSSTSWRIENQDSLPECLKGIPVQ